MSRNKDLKICILGSGLAGLLTYHTLLNSIISDRLDITIISDIIPRVPKYPLAPSVIQLAPETYALARELYPVTSISTATIHIGFKSGSDIHPAPSESFKQDYSLITRGTSEYHQSILSGQQTELSIITIDDAIHSLLPLQQKLLSLYEDNITLDRVGLVAQTLDQKLKVESVTGRDLGTYDIIVNTIPAPIFLRQILDIEYLYSPRHTLLNKLPDGEKLRELLVKPIDKFITNKLFVLGEVNDFKSLGLNMYEYVYSVSDLFQRATLVDFDKGLVAFELPKCAKNFTNSQLKGILNLKSIETFVVLQNQIVRSLDLKNISTNLYLIGRFSKLSQGYLINDVLNDTHILVSEIFSRLQST